MTATPNRRHGFRGNRRGFTLIEALMACGILLIMVMAVSTAVTAGQQHAHYAQQRIAGTLAAEELMGRYQIADYHDLSPMHQIEPVGTLEDIEGESFPETFARVGREIWVTRTYMEIPSPKVQMNGLTIRVRTFDDQNQTLADISRFVAEPALDTVTEEEAESQSSSDGLLGSTLRRLLGW